MSKTLTVVRKEYLERVRSKSFLIGTVLVPVLMSMVIVLPALLEKTGGQEARTIGVIDPSGRYLGPLHEALRDQEKEHITLLPISVEGRQLSEGINDLKGMILNEAVHSGLVIDADFTESRQVTFYNKSVSALVMLDDVLRPALNRVLRQSRFQNAGVPDSLHAYLAAASSWTTIAVTAAGDEEEQNEAVSFAMAFGMILIIYIMVIMYGSHTLTAVIEEKSSRVVELLLSSISPGNLMLGKIIGIGLAGLTQFAIWTGSIMFLSLQGVSVGRFDLDFTFLNPLILVSFLVFFILGFFLYASIYAGVGAMCNSVQDSQQFHTPIVMGLVLPMLMLGFVLRAPDSTLSVVLSLIPIFAPVLMFMRVCVQTPPVWQVVLSWLLLILAIWGTARMSGKLFRLGILMYGASPTWLTLGRALRS